MSEFDNREAARLLDGYRSLLNDLKDDLYGDKERQRPGLIDQFRDYQSAVSRDIKQLDQRLTLLEHAQDWGAVRQMRDDIQAMKQAQQERKWIMRGIGIGISLVLTFGGAIGWRILEILGQHAAAPSFPFP